MTDIRGEYWIDERGDLEFADGDVSDDNHESIASKHIFSQYADDIINLCQEVGVEIDENIDDIDPESLKQALWDVKDEIDEENPDLYIMNQLNVDKETYGILLGVRNSNVVLHVMKFEKWIAVRGNNVDLYQYDDQRRKQLLNGLEEIFDQEGIEKSPDEEEMEFWINDFKTNKSWSLTFTDIQSPIITRTSAANVQSKGHSKFQVDPDDGENNPKTMRQMKSIPNKTNVAAQGAGIIQPGTSLWRPTSETNMNFKEWLKLNEMPITNFNLVGQWGKDAKRAYGFSKKDTGILENPKAVEKIHKNGQTLNMTLIYIL
jgi:hypothetical protein